MTHRMTQFCQYRAMRISDSSFPINYSTELYSSNTYGRWGSVSRYEKKSAVLTIGVFSAFLYLFSFLQTERKHCFPFLLRKCRKKHKKAGKQCAAFLACQYTSPSRSQIRLYIQGRKRRERALAEEEERRERKWRGKRGEIKNRRRKRE